jgi:hypothetical protein
MRIAELIVAAAVLIGPTAVIADQEMVVTGQAPPKASRIDEQAVNACAAAFASKVLPAGHAPVRVVMPSQEPPIFSKLDAMDRESSKLMEVTMEAYAAGVAQPVARSVCTVGIHAIVVDLTAERAGPAVAATPAAQQITIAAQFDAKARRS